MKETAETTLRTLPKDLLYIVVPDKGKGANWARNQGFKRVSTEYVLFSDNDIKWRENAILSLLKALEEHPEASYSYGAYKMGDQIYCDQEFDEDLLYLTNYISTMSLVRTKDFPGFDEKIERFQDWDVWLTMLEDGKKGVYCGEVIFDTDVREGITLNGPDLVKSFNVIREKHNL